MLKKLISRSLLVVLISGYTTFSVHAADLTLKLHHFLPAASPAHKSLFVPWAKSIEEESDGRIKVKIYPSMTLGGKPPQLIDQVTDGFVDVVWTNPGYTPGRFPAISAFELPFMVTNAVSTSKALQGYYEKNEAVQNEFSDLHPLFFWTHDKGVIFTKSEAADSVFSIKGKKLRTPNRVLANAFSRLDAIPVGMPVPQMPEALAKGVIDGSVAPFEIVPALRLHELVDFGVEVSDNEGRGLYTSTFILAMNKKRYEALDAELKKVIDNHSGMQWATKAGEVFANSEAAGIELFDSTATRSQMAADEVLNLKSIVEPMYADWVKEMTEKGLPSQQLLDSATELLKQYSVSK